MILNFNIQYIDIYLYVYIYIQYIHIYIYTYIYIYIYMCKPSHLTSNVKQHIVKIDIK